MARDCHACFRALLLKLADGEGQRPGIGIQNARAMLNRAGTLLTAGDADGFRQEIDRVMPVLYDLDMAGTPECLEILNNHVEEPVAA